MPERRPIHRLKQHGSYAEARSKLGPPDEEFLRMANNDSYPTRPCCCVGNPRDLCAWCAERTDEVAALRAERDAARREVAYLHFERDKRQRECDRHRAERGERIAEAAALRAERDRMFMQWEEERDIATLAIERAERAEAERDELARRLDIAMGNLKRRQAERDAMRPVVEAAMQRHREGVCPENYDAIMDAYRKSTNN